MEFGGIKGQKDNLEFQGGTSGFFLNYFWDDPIHPSS